MSNRIGDKNLGGLMDYMDSLVAKGRVKSSAIIPLKTAVRQIFETVEKDNWENIAIETIDIDDYMERFKNIALDRYNIDSYNTYRGRANKALNWYKNFLQDPGWIPSVRKNSVSANKKTGVLENAQKITSGSIVPNNNLINYTFPMSDGTLSTLSLPKFITQEDSDRLAKFISMLVIGGKNDL